MRWTCVREIPSIAGAICSLRSFECQQTSPHSGLREGPSGRQRRQFWTPARTGRWGPVSSVRRASESKRLQIRPVDYRRQPPILLYRRVYGRYFGLLPLSWLTSYTHCTDGLTRSLYFLFCFRQAGGVGFVPGIVDSVPFDYCE